MAQWFSAFLDRAKERGVSFVSLADEAAKLNADRASIPVAPLEQGEIDGRSGTLAVQGPRIEGLAA